MTDRLTLTRALENTSCRVLPAIRAVRGLRRCPVTTMSMLRLPHCEHTSRRLPPTGRS